MKEENPYLRPAFDEGAARARLCISRNDDPTMCSNPYLPSTDDFRAWNLGWNTTLMSELRTHPPPTAGTAREVGPLWAGLPLLKPLVNAEK